LNYVIMAHVASFVIKARAPAASQQRTGCARARGYGPKGYVGVSAGSELGCGRRGGYWAIARFVGGCDLWQRRSHAGFQRVRAVSAQGLWFPDARGSQLCQNYQSNRHGAWEWGTMRAAALMRWLNVQVRKPPRESVTARSWRGPVPGKNWILGCSAR